jgi:hypothetical protein
MWAHNLAHKELHQRGFRIEWGCDGFVVPHAESLQNGFNVALLMHDNGVGLHIPLKMNSNEEIQLVEVTHLELALEARFQLIDHVHISCQNDEILYIYDYNHNIMASL